MTQKLRKFGRLSSYAFVLFAASLFSFILQFKNQKQDEHKITLVPPVPTVLADIIASDGSDNPSECAACSCTCADGSSDGAGADGSDGDAGGNF